jgi:hypothetical protein
MRLAGDVLVQQVSKARTRREEKRLETLGLRKHVRFSYAYTDREEIRGVVEKVRHRVRLYRLALPLREVESTGDRHMDQTDVSQHDYEIAGREAHLFNVARNQYLRVELFSNYFAMTWSSALPLTTTLDRTSNLLPDREQGKAVLYSLSRTSYLHQELHSALKMLHHRPQDFAFVRLEFPEHTVIWRAPKKRRPPDTLAPSELGQFGLLSEVYDLRYATSLIRRTATLAVASNTDRLTEHVEYLSKHVPVGSLFPTDGGVARGVVT